MARNRYDEIHQATRSARARSLRKLAVAEGYISADEFLYLSGVGSRPSNTREQSARLSMALDQGKIAIEDYASLLGLKGRSFRDTVVKR